MTEQNTPDSKEWLLVDEQDGHIVMEGIESQTEARHEAALTSCVPEGGAPEVTIMTRAEYKDNDTTRSQQDGYQPEHRLMLGNRWGEKAESNVEQWGNQRHDTVFLAMIEEVGEIAMAMESNNGPGGGLPPVGDYDDRADRGRQLIHRMAELGRDTREFLESEYPAPAGDPGVEKDGEIAVHGDPRDTDPIIEEVEDAAPLLWQFYWAIMATSETNTDSTQTGSKEQGST